MKPIKFGLSNNGSFEMRVARITVTIIPLRVHANIKGISYNEAKKIHANKVFRANLGSTQVGNEFIIKDLDEKLSLRFELEIMRKTREALEGSFKLWTGTGWKPAMTYNNFLKVTGMATNVAKQYLLNSPHYSEGHLKGVTGRPFRVVINHRQDREWKFEAPYNPESLLELVHKIYGRRF